MVAILVAITVVAVLVFHKEHAHEQARS